MCSERVIDTSSLQSTKTIGQKKEAKQTEGRIQSVDTLKNDSSISEGNKRDDGDQFALTQPQPPLSVDLEAPQIGTALKISSLSLDEHKPLVKRKWRCQNKPSWRQRLHDTYPKSKIMDNEYSDRHLSSSSSENDEYSEWSGFSSDDSAIVDPKDALFESKKDVNLPKGLDRSSVTAVAKQESGTKEESSQQRAKYFKLWAREQSGFGGSQSNISSLPRFPIVQREVVTADFSGHDCPQTSASNDVKSKRVSSRL